MSHSSGNVGDAFGRFLLDRMDGKAGHEIVERDDGLLMVTNGQMYFDPFRRWAFVERRALRLMRGRVLDVGCGAGRLTLELQRRGLEAVGFDSSPLAVQVARQRGVGEAHLLPLEQLDGRFGLFDTVAMYGNNFGLFGSPAKSRRLLRRLLHLTTPAARIVASSLDPYQTDDPAHVAYQERNRSRKRMSGQLRIRVRYREIASRGSTTCSSHAKRWPRSQTRAAGDSSEQSTTKARSTSVSSNPVEIGVRTR